MLAMRVVLAPQPTDRAKSTSVRRDEEMVPERIRSMHGYRPLNGFRLRLLGYPAVM